MPLAGASPPSGGAPLADTLAISPKWSVRSLLLLLVFACLIPTVLGAGVFFIYKLQEGGSELEKDTALVTRALIQTVDAEFRTAQVIAEALATSSVIENFSCLTS